MYTNAINELVIKTHNPIKQVNEYEEDFSVVLGKKTAETDQTPARLKEQAGHEDERRNRQRKVIEMRSRIAELKSQISEPGSNEKLESELSLLQMEMFWIMSEA